MLILKITGLILLGLIALLLFVLLLVLFVPVRYKACFSKQDKNMTGSAGITWLLRLLSIKIKYKDKKLEKSGRIAFFKLLKEKEEEPKEKEPEKKKPSGKKHKKKKKHKKGLSVVDRLKNIYENRDEVVDLWEEYKPEVSKAFKRIGKLVLHIIPKRSGGFIDFGFEDPSTTGKVLGGVSAIYGFTGALFELRPDFEDPHADCDIWIQGRVRIFTVALIFVLLYFNKELKKAGKRFIQLSERV